MIFVDIMIAGIFVLIGLYCYPAYCEYVEIVYGVAQKLLPEMDIFGITFFKILPYAALFLLFYGAYIWVRRQHINRGE